MESTYAVHRFTSDDTLIRKYTFTCASPAATFETSSFRILQPDRHDLCVSTMAGCPMRCNICSTTFSATPFERLLTAEEICEQVRLAVQERVDIDPETVLRIGFMGSGEPFENFAVMTSAIRWLVMEEQYSIGEIAISTLGVNIYRVHELAAVMREVGVGIKLQLSLYSIDPAVRKDLLPLAPPLESILAELDWYASESGIPVRYNVPLIAGVNNTLEQLSALRDFLREKPALRRLKLSAFNSFPGNALQACADEELLNTVAWFEGEGLKVDLFLGNRDGNVFASCGQMRAEALKP